MEKEKSVRKRSTEKYVLPVPPPDPLLPRSDLPDAFKRIIGYKEREANFFKTLKETIQMESVRNSSDASSSCGGQHSTARRQNSNGSSCSSGHMGGGGSDVPVTSEDGARNINETLLSEECDNYVLPLLRRTGPSISAALVTEGAIDQLDKLHGILEQLLHMQEQNYKLRRSARDIDTLNGLKKIQKQISKDPDAFINLETSDPENDLELEYNESLLETILAAGKSASNKRNSSKRNRMRSKSVITDDQTSNNLLPDKDLKQYPLRRQSAITDIKAKVSKWTKVKAAFKWERANPSLNEGKSTDSGIGLSPINNEVARYLRVPSIPCTGSSADSVLSSSSGHMLSGGSIPPTPGTMSSASSIEDVGVASEDFPPNFDGQLGAATVAPAGTSTTPTTTSGSTPNSPMPPLSPCFVRNDDCDYQRTSSMLQSPQTTPTPSASGTASFTKSSMSSATRNTIRKSKMVLDIACLPEGVPLDLTTLPAAQRGTKPPPSPLNLAGRQALLQDSSDTDQFADHKGSPLMQRRNMNWTARTKKPIMTANASAPNSPSQQYEFFGEFESEDLSSGDFSEPCTPHKQLSPKNSLAHQQEEINRKYHELKQQISLEFQAKQKEWERIRVSSVATGTSPIPYCQKDEGNHKDGKSLIVKPIEENLTADFKKKLQEWRIKKQQSQSNSSVKDVQTASPTKESDSKKIDWHLWKTGQIKLEGQGLKQMPDEKDLPEDFQKKLDEWKRIKAGGSSSSASTSDSTIKRSSLKSNQLLKYEFGNSKKLKSSTTEDLANDLNAIERERQRLERERAKFAEREKAEKLMKLKSMVVEPPAKEVVVQTSKGVLKFEGISRKFTRKLYEWEKARGIGPEASTFALLHPGYRPLVVGNGEGETDTGSPMGRSLSMDSVSPHASVPSISHQPSSLSLNNVDDLIETNSITQQRNDSSNSDLELDDDATQEEEPEAVIVEVEDDYVETADSLFTATPMMEQQTPVYRYEQTRKEYYSAGKKEAVFLGESKPIIADSASKALKDATRMVSEFKEVKHGFKENILHVQTVLRSLVETLPTLKSNLQSNSQLLQESVDIVRDLAKDIVGMLTRLEESASSKEDLDVQMTAIDMQLGVLRKTLNFICKHTSERKTSRPEDVPEISITSDDVDSREKNIAIVSVTPAIFQGQVIINQVHIMEDHHSISVDSLPPPPPLPTEISDCDNSNKNTSDTTVGSVRSPISEQDVKKITRNLNNGNKRKTKLRRLGSRQNSKTESDSDEEPANVVLDTPRRVKRKTSRAKKANDSFDKADEQTPSSTPPQPGDDVVYVLKIKPGQMIEQTEVAYDFTVQTDESLLVEVVDPTGDNVDVTSNVFVKTKRKIFTPVDDQGCTVIGKEIESSASDKNDNESAVHADDIPECRLVTNLPPLPQSPSMQRRLDQKSNPPKEPSPAIRLMIAKYNQRLSDERRNSSPHSSGSCSPVAWRSPVLERRVRNQTEKYIRQVTKSSSAGNVQKEEKPREHQSDVKEAHLTGGVLKSSSAGILSSHDNWMINESTLDSDVCRTSLACDSLKKIAISKKDIVERCPDEKHEGLYRKNLEYPISLPIAISKSGTYRKILSKSPSKDDHAMDDVPDKASNTVPKIKRKYDAKPPSPRLQRPRPNLQLNIRKTSLLPPRDHSPDTPLSDRALKLKRAKEEFLRMSNHRSPCYCQAEDIWKNRLSQISAGSGSSGCAGDDMIITKSASVGMINSAGTDCIQSGGYESLPRNSTRPSKSQGAIGKFGLSTIASKLKKVKLRRNSKELTKMNTVSTLCRQSLMVDISRTGGKVAANQNDNGLAASAVTSGPSSLPAAISDEVQLRKSGSAQAMGFGSLLFRRQERAQKLKKSKSIGQLTGNSDT